MNILPSLIAVSGTPPEDRCETSASVIPPGMPFWPATTRDILFRPVHFYIFIIAEHLLLQRHVVFTHLLTSTKMKEDIPMRLHLHWIVYNLYLRGL